MKNFWKELDRPFLAMAPMEDVTDTVFRQIVSEVAKPDVMYTEFVNVDGIVEMTTRNAKMGARLPGRCRRPAARPFSSIPARSQIDHFKENGVLQRLVYSEKERPVVAQIWGSKPENFYKAAKFISEGSCLPAGRFDGIDINMGCPERKIMKTGGGAALIGDSDRVREIIQATKDGAGDLPVSVKTRIGNKKIITEDWIGFLLEQELAAIAIHGRTVTELSKVPAHWDEIEKVVKFAARNAKMGARLPGRCRRPAARPFSSIPVQEEHKERTLIIGNGDVKDYREAMEKVEEYGVDGVMIGRGVLGNLAAFSKQSRLLSFEEKMRIFRRHVETYRETWGKNRSYFALRKFVKLYVSGVPKAGKIREKIMSIENYDELIEEISKYV